VVTDENAIEFVRQVWSRDAQHQAPIMTAAQSYMARLFRLLK